MNRRTKQLGKRPPPEFRLWSVYLGFLTVLVGEIVFLVQLGKIGMRYNVSPVIGVAIAAFGNQVVTTVLVTCTKTFSLPAHSVQCFQSS